MKPPNLISMLMGRIGEAKYKDEGSECRNNDSHFILDMYPSLLILTLFKD